MRIATEKRSVFVDPSAGCNPQTLLQASVNYSQEIKNNMSRLAIVLTFLAPSLAFGQDLQANVTDVTYILEDEVPGIGIKVDISEWVAEDEMSKLAQEICEGVVPEVLPQLAERNDLEAPTFIEVDAKVPRSFGIISVNVGQVHRFSYNDDGTCAPLWVDD